MAGVVTTGRPSGTPGSRQPSRHGARRRHRTPAAASLRYNVHTPCRPFGDATPAAGTCHGGAARPRRPRRRTSRRWRPGQTCGQWSWSARFKWSWSRRRVGPSNVAPGRRRGVTQEEMASRALAAHDTRRHAANRPLRQPEISAFGQRSFRLRRWKSSAPTAAAALTAAESSRPVRSTPSAAASTCPAERVSPGRCRRRARRCRRARRLAARRGLREQS